MLYSYYFFHKHSNQVYLQIFINLFYWFLILNGMLLGIKMLLFQSNVQVLPLNQSFNSEFTSSISND